MLAANRLLRLAESRNSRSLQLHFISNNTRKAVNQVKPSKVKYEYVDPDEVERLDYYVPGGYHPVQIGDEFHVGRYVIVHKLGFGRSATTWLAEDKQNNRLVALKISKAESAERTIHESQVLTRLGQAKSQLSGKAIVQTLLDSFSFLGPNGSHQCLVLDAARINIDEAKEAAYHRLLHLLPSRAIASQLILGVQFVHSQGIVHGGMS
ncbi:Kinase domain-containing protein [Aspergillus sclerotialis]|uniref:non-specific serine/threonine protein kinase n=1 Tax=Aspergillus sclerotialis TaxID=2070753 RepID=A0A3A3AAA1_9EURO|nr:Kinase domain-containing protein [Aspergillus sclerotialis]